MAMTGKKRPMIIGPKSGGILAGALTVASGGWLIGVLLGYIQWQFAPPSEAQASNW
jgi:uncharacterized protein with beta-barrel porin domain